MMLYEVNQDALRYELEHLGVYKPSVDIMLGKGKITPLKVLHVRTPAANIIKQEMLAAGGEATAPRRERQLPVRFPMWISCCLAMRSIIKRWSIS